jgi:hypothetical protein
MYSSTTQQVSVSDENLNVVKLKFIMSIMNVIIGQAQAKFVPAAAVKRIVQVFDLMTGCKRPQRRLDVFS